jgi:hypothetical protein
MSKKNPEKKNEKPRGNPRTVSAGKKRKRRFKISPKKGER